MEESDFRVSERPENGETESEGGEHGKFPREIGLGREEGGGALRATVHGPQGVGHN